MEQFNNALVSADVPLFSVAPQENATPPAPPASPGDNGDASMLACPGGLENSAAFANGATSLTGNATRSSRSEVRLPLHPTGFRGPRGPRLQGPTSRRGGHFKRLACWDMASTRSVRPHDTKEVLGVAVLQIPPFPKAVYTAPHVSTCKVPCEGTSTSGASASAPAVDDDPGQVDGGDQDIADKEEDTELFIEDGKVSLLTAKEAEDKRVAAAKRREAAEAAGSGSGKGKDEEAAKEKDEKAAVEYGLACALYGQDAADKWKRGKQKSELEDKKGTIMDHDGDAPEPSGPEGEEEETEDDDRSSASTCAESTAEDKKETVAEPVDPPVKMTVFTKKGAATTVILESTLPSVIRLQMAELEPENE